MCDNFPVKCEEYFFVVSGDDGVVVDEMAFLVCVLCASLMCSLLCCQKKLVCVQGVQGV